ncbi:MAG: hypothetical protein OCD03_13625 [Hyphomicrobiales bacterium]
MADIIDFRAKAKPYRKQSQSKTEETQLGQIILFSGVRFQRDEDVTFENQTNKTQKFLSTKSN